MSTKESVCEPCKNGDHSRFRQIEHDGIECTCGVCDDTAMMLGGHSDMDSESVLQRVLVRHCTCTAENPNDHRTIEATLVKYEDGTYGRE